MKHSAKWKKRKLNAKMLFEDILADAKTINKELTSDELDMISDLNTKHTGGKMNFKKSSLKNVKVNAKCMKFGDKSCVESCRKKIKKRKSLSMCSLNILYLVLEKSTIPTTLLNTPKRGKRSSSVYLTQHT